MFADIKVKRNIYSSEEHQLIRTMTQQFIEKEITPFHAEWE